MTGVDIERAAELFTRDGTCVYLQTERSDFSDLIELIEAVEALCPQWPQREQSVRGSYRL